VRHLVLFDVDGTLLSAGGRGGRAIAHALQETFGTPGPIESYSFSGKTDPQIVFELMAAAGVERSQVVERLPRVFDLYLDMLRDTLTPDNIWVLPGVRTIIEELTNRDDVVCGLLTGNIAEGAACKLKAARLDSYFPFGAFGSDHEDRDRLVAIARERAAALTCEDFPGRQTVVVGDAEADIRCARAGGARVVSVATGTTSLPTLAALKPDGLLDSLASPDALATLLATDA
jgi:phosphoglycolate phosphatase